MTRRAAPVFEVVGRTANLLTVRVRVNLGAVGNVDFLAPLTRKQARKLRNLLRDWLELGRAGGTL